MKNWTIVATRFNGAFYVESCDDSWVDTRRAMGNSNGYVTNVDTPNFVVIEWIGESAPNYNHIVIFVRNS